MEKIKLGEFRKLDNVGRVNIPKKIREYFQLSTVEFFTLSDENWEYLCIGKKRKNKMIENQVAKTREEMEKYGIKSTEIQLEKLRKKLEENSHKKKDVIARQ